MGLEATLLTWACFTGEAPQPAPRIQELTHTLTSKRRPLTLRVCLIVPSTASDSFKPGCFFSDFLGHGADAYDYVFQILGNPNQVPCDGQFYMTT